MLKILNYIKNLILNGINGIPFDYYLFLFLFFSRLFELFIAGNIFSVFGDYQHEFLLFEKYTYFLTAGYLFVYILVYLISCHKLPFSRTMWIAIFFFAEAIISTLINQRDGFRYDYFGKLSILELMMTLIFMFFTASRLSEQQFRKLLRITGKGFLYLILLLNIVSLAIFILRPASSVFTLFGREIELPSIFFDDRPGREYFSFDGFYRNTQTLGLNNSLALTLCIYFLVRHEIHPISGASLIVSCVVMILLAHTRTGLIMSAITAAFCFGIYLYKNSSSRRNLFKPYCWMLVVSIFAAGGYAVHKFINLYHRFDNDFMYALDRFGSARISIIKEALRMFLESPLIGTGWHVSFLKYDTAHNVFITVMTWTGIIGLLLFLFLIADVIRKGIRTGTICKNPFLFFVPMSVLMMCQLEQGILGDARHAYTYLFWLVLGYFAVDYAKNNSDHSK